MTARELLQMLQTQVSADSEINQSDITMTQVYDKGDGCVARILAPLENKTRVLEITVKEICVHDGL